MSSKKTDFFWPSYTDLMTSLFFIMLVLYVLTYVRLRSTITLQKEKLAIIETVEENLRPLKSDRSLFTYEEQYKRFKLAFDVEFITDKYEMRYLVNPVETIRKIDSAGRKLKSIIDNLYESKNDDPKLKNVSYILVISGSASKTGDEYHNYELSYKRAWNLWKHWNNIGINFEDKKYKGLIDLQITGNGFGGVGRIQPDESKANQRFLIQIFPKIGDIQ